MPLKFEHVSFLQWLWVQSSGKRYGYRDMSRGTRSWGWKQERVAYLNLYSSTGTGTTTLTDQIRPDLICDQISHDERSLNPNLSPSTMYVSRFPAHCFDLGIAREVVTSLVRLRLFPCSKCRQSLQRIIFINKMITIRLKLNNAFCKPKWSIYKLGLLFRFICRIKNKLFELILETKALPAEHSYWRTSYVQFTTTKL